MGVTSMKKNILSILFLCCISTCAKEKDGAYQFISNLYSNYQNGNVNFAYNGPSADTIFSLDLLKLIRLDQKLAQGMVGYLDSDPLCDCQMSDGFIMNKINIFNKSDSTFADIEFKVANTTNRLLLLLENSKNKWLIRDIISSTGSLYQFLSKNLAEDNPNSIYKK